MSTNPRAALVFGFDLNTSNDSPGWLIEEADEDGWIDFGWLYDIEDEYPDFAQAVERALLVADGTYTNSQIAAMNASDGSDWVNKELARLRGVQVYAYGHHELRRFALAGTVQHESDYTPLVVNPDDLGVVSTGFTRDAVIANLRWATGVLGITPIQPKPAWLLCSSCA